MIEKKEFENKFLNLEKALENLKKSIVMAKKEEKEEVFDMMRDSCIQRFEYNFELIRKFMKFLLEKQEKEIETRSPNQVIKTAFKVWYIDDIQKWIDMSEYRSKTSHEYDKYNIEDLYPKIPIFFEEMQKFYELIKMKYEKWYFR